MKNYYIVSNKQADGATKIFWKENGCGYTLNLDEAGIYTEEDVERMKYKVISKDNLREQWRYDNFFIEVTDIELLGKKMTCIYN